MTFEQENEQLLYDILNENFYEGFRDSSKKRYSGNLLELNITAACNQKCEYCYLTKYGKEIYPVEIRNEEKIIENMKILIAYYLKEKMHPGKLDIFSGEIWGTQFGNAVLAEILEGIKRGWGIDYIMIPSNMSFIMEEDKFNNVKQFIEKFKESGCRLVFSASVDGLLLDEEQRSLKDEEKNRFRSVDFYEKLFTWCKEMKFAFHPMVAAHGIENWVENYQWWQHMFSKYHLDPFEYGMYLEVRNDEWTIEKIDSYLDFLNSMIEHDFHKLLGSELGTFVKEAVFCGKQPKKGYFPYVLLDSGNTYNCTINTSLIVRLGDLAIGPCHRTHYEKFLYGRYRVENGVITGLDANNVQLANVILNGTSKNIMQCEKCPISYNCMRGCLGAQYEATGEILQPCSSVCQLLKARLIFLYLKYKKMGVFRFVSENHDAERTAFLGQLENACVRLRKGEPNLWNYWEAKTMKKIS